VLEGWAPAIAVAEVAPIEVTTRAGQAPVLPGATLTTAAGATKLVDVTWDAVSPSDYAAPGTFEVRGVATDDSRMPVTATVTVTAGLDVAAGTRCVAGKVVVTAKVTNPSAESTSVTVSSVYGERTVTVDAGASAVVAFSSRLATVPAGQVSATVDGVATTAAYEGRSC